MNQNDVFSTTDLYLAAFLESKGLELLDVQRQPGTRRCLFLFRDRPDRTEVVASYWADEPVGARSFVAACKELKQRVYGVL